MLLRVLGTQHVTFVHSALWRTCLVALLDVGQQEFYLTYQSLSGPATNCGSDNRLRLMLGVMPKLSKA
jgi:hypothetical protein